jgi:hypothetical protein
VVRTDLSLTRWQGSRGRRATVSSGRAAGGKDAATWLGGGYRWATSLDGAQWREVARKTDATAALTE